METNRTNEPILKKSNSLISFGTNDNAEKSKIDTRYSSSLNKFYRHMRSSCSRKLRVENQLVREFLAELFGTFVFLSFALGSVAQYKLQQIGNLFNEANFLSVNISFGLGLTLSIIMVGNISGGHLNPAVSFSMLLIKKLSVWKFILYVIAQSIGSFLAALMVYLVYLDQLRAWPGGMYTIGTASIFSTYPNDMINPQLVSYFIDEFFASSLFIIAILAITDKKNNLQQPFVALFIGLTLLTIGTSYGFHSGFAINPARDLWPRIFTAIAGWGWEQVFTTGKNFFWIPILGPMLGSLVGTTIYCLFISNHHIEDEEEEKENDNFEQIN